MKPCYRVFFLTLFIESLTIMGRFGFNFQSTRDTASTIGKITFGVRVHHGYIGILINCIIMFLKKTNPNIKNWIITLGLSLIFSDLIHHFLVLCPITGHHHFDLIYYHNRVTGGFSPPVPTTPDMRVRIRRFISICKR